ncbi:MAG: glycosyltransferase [Anaerolineae bacterium]|nr:glycosyltransferase [Anaerolineae bacterium]
MRITVVTSSYPRFPGDGAAPFVQSICQHLAQLGHQIEVIAPYDPLVCNQPNQVVPVHRFRYVPVKQWHIIGHARSLVGDMHLRRGIFLLLPLFLIAEFWATLRVAWRQKADIIHVHWVLPNGLAGALVALILRIPLAVSLHGSDIFIAQRHWVLGGVARWIFKQAAVITACSEYLRSSAICLGACPEKVHLIVWGADPARFHPGVTPFDRSVLGLKSDDIVIAALGRMVPKKGFDVLVQALPLILRSFKDVHLVIGGDGIQRDELFQIAKKLGIERSFHLPGQIPWDKVPAFLNMADIVVVPSVPDMSGNLDGLPTVLLEAMAVGKPVVATKVGGVELVIRDGENGLLCPPGDPYALSAAVVLLLKDKVLRSRLGRAARQSVESRFNWHRVALSLEILFREMVTPL